MNVSHSLKSNLIKEVTFMSLTVAQRQSLDALVFYATEPLTQDKNKGRKLLRLQENATGKYLEVVFEKDVKWDFKSLVEAFFGFNRHNLNTCVSFLRKELLPQVTLEAQKQTLSPIIRKLNEKIDKHDKRFFKIFTIGTIHAFEAHSSDSQQEQAVSKAVQKSVNSFVNKGKSSSSNQSCSITPGKEFQCTEAQKFALPILKVQLEAATSAIARISTVGGSKVKNADIEKCHRELKVVENAIRLHFSSEQPDELAEPLRFAKDLLKGLEASLKVGLIDYSMHYVFDKKVPDIIREKGDGNCLFRVVRDGIEFLGGTKAYLQKLGLPMPRGEIYSIQELRDLSINYFKENYRKNGWLFSRIKEAIDQQNDAYEDDWKKHSDSLIESILMTFSDVLDQPSLKKREVVKFLQEELLKLKSSGDVPYEKLSKGIDTIHEVLLACYLDSLILGLIPKSTKTHHESTELQEIAMLRRQKQEVLQIMKNKANTTAERLLALQQIHNQLKKNLLYKRADDANSVSRLGELVQEFDMLQNQLPVVRKETIDRIIPVPRVGESPKKTDNELIERAFQEYFKLASQDGYWATVPQLYAFKHIFQLDIKVSRLRNGTRELDRACQELLGDPIQARGCIHFDFEGLSHFNLYIENTNEVRKVL